MKAIISFKNLQMVLMTIMCLTMFCACGSDDDDTIGGGGSGSANEMMISGKSYGSLPYGQFSDWGDGYALFIFSNIRMVNAGTDTPFTFLSVRIPYTTSGIPQGTFSTEADADFDVNRIASTGKCDLTGWCMKLTMTVARSGDKYTVDFSTSDLHIFHSDEETGNGQSGSLTLHYEGNLEVVKNN